MPVTGRLALLAALLGLLACEAPFRSTAPAAVSVASVTVLPDSALLVPGDSLTLTATVRDSTGAVLRDRAVSWTSTAPALVTVTGTGTVTAVAVGSGAIVAATEGRADTAYIDVAERVFLTVAAGGLHTCARTNDGHAFCWGFNLYGQAGIGLISFIEATPVPVGGAWRPSMLAAGADHSCGIATDGVLSCWGRNDRSQLGRGTDPGDPTLPGPVLSGARFTSVTAGESHSCALDDDGSAWCWGDNVEGQLGDSQTIARASPVAVHGGPFTRVSAGAAFTCAVAGGVAWCWGTNRHAELGDSTLDDYRAYPRPVRSAVPFESVSAGARHACAVSALSLLCWGDNRAGQTGTGASDTTVLAPSPVISIALAMAVAAGGRHTCALLADSTAVCWGANDRGQLGDGTMTPHALPSAVAGGRKFGRLSAGRDHTCAVTPARVEYCWGAGTEGQLGNGVIADSPVPVATRPPVRVTTPPQRSRLAAPRRAFPRP